MQTSMFNEYESFSDKKSKLYQTLRHKFYTHKKTNAINKSFAKVVDVSKIEKHLEEEYFNVEINWETYKKKWVLDFKDEEKAGDGLFHFKNFIPKEMVCVSYNIDTDKRECVNCKVIQSVTNFSVKSKMYYAYECKKCENKYATIRNRIKKIKLKVFQKQKLSIKEIYNKINTLLETKPKMNWSNFGDKWYNWNISLENDIITLAFNDRRIESLKNGERICYECKETRNLEEDFYKSNIRTCKKCKKLYEQKNKEKINKRKRSKKYRKNRNKRKNFLRQTNPQKRIVHSLRERIRKVIKLKFTSKAALTKELLGCEFFDLKQHLESQFVEGMSWDNYGSPTKEQKEQLIKEGKNPLKHFWHIDHIKPCASFDLTIVAEQRKCFHYTNLQPLWAYDNIIKSNKA